jgi:NADPH:quinone reductase-like Zn-dependent oxidoreductase
MKAVQLVAPGFEGITVADLAEPSPGRGEVLLRMKAASVNFRDVAVALGKYPGVRHPLVPLSDGVGVVEAVGEGVTRVKPGDRVCPIFAPSWLSGPGLDDTAAGLGGDLDGVLRQWMTAPAESVVHVPEHLSDVEAATLPCAAVTAWSALVEFGRVKPGDTVLIEGTGGVALFALQFAKLAGARVAVLSSSEEKLATARAMGANLVFNYRETPEWGQVVRAATGGVDIVIETVGAETLAQAVATVGRGGRIAQVGFLSGVEANLPLQFFVRRTVSLQGILVGGRDRFEAMNKAIALHGLKPVISETLPFSELKAALAKLGRGDHLGKVTLTID